MGKRVRIRPGFTEVRLPNGNAWYDGGNEVHLSDFEYSHLEAEAHTWLEDLGNESDPPGYGMGYGWGGDFGGGGFGDGEGLTSWQRPGDWLSIDAEPVPGAPVEAPEPGLVGLVAVYPGDVNYVALSAAGAYTVDWGDGTEPENFATGIQANHNFLWASVEDDTEAGFRQAIVEVFAQDEEVAPLTSINLGLKHASGGTQSPWLDVTVAGETLTSLTLQGVAKPGLLQHFTFAGPTGLTNVTDLFKFAPALAVVGGKQFAATITNFSNMFSGCISLESVEEMDTVAGVNFSGMFTGCTSLATVPEFLTTAGTDFSSMFLGCSNLKIVPLLDTAAGLNFTSMFSGCTTLTAVPALDTTAGTNFATIFTGCPSLRAGVLTGTEVSISYASAGLSGPALDAIYTALAAGVVAQTITVTGNWGIGTDTPAIATAKGWTVTGS